MAFFLSNSNYEVRQWRNVRFNSSVDVDVFNNAGVLSARIVGNIVDESIDGEVVAWVYEFGGKVFYLPLEGEFTFKITGSGCGTMTYVVEDVTSYGSIVSQKTFQNVQVFYGKEMFSIVGESMTVPEVRLFVTEDGEIVDEIIGVVTITRRPQGGTGGGGGGFTQPPTQPTEEDETYEEEMPLAEVAEFPFTDISQSAWYYHYVRTVWENELFHGTAYNQFSPHVGMTRAMFVQVLANLENVDTTTFTTSIFNDVSTNAW